MGTRSTGDQLEEVLIASRATDEDIEAGLLNSSSKAGDSQGYAAPQNQRPPKRNVSGLGQRLRESFKGQSEMSAPAPSRPPLTGHPSPPKSAMKKSAGFQMVSNSSPAGSVTGTAPATGSPLDKLPAAPHSDHARSFLPEVGKSWEEQHQQGAKRDGVELAGQSHTKFADFDAPSTSFRIAAGGDARSRQSRLGSDVRDTFPENDDEDDDDDDKDGKKAFAKFDEPTRIEGEGGGVDPDPGDRDSEAESDVEEDLTVTHKKHRRFFGVRWKYLKVFLAVMWCLCFVAAGIVLRRNARTASVVHFQLWRWCFFFCGLTPIYYIANYFIYFVTIAVESRFFPFKQALYYLISIRTGLERCVKMGMVIGLWVWVFQNRAQMDKSAWHFYLTVRKVMFCGLLFLGGNVLKKALAKLFSSHFYKATHYDKMQDALRKEFFIVALAQPREDREEDDPMKHRPTALAELRTKSFAATGALFQRLKSVRGPSVTSAKLTAQKSFASHSSLTDTDDEEEHQQAMQPRAHSISNCAAMGASPIQQLSKTTSVNPHKTLSKQHLKGSNLGFQRNDRLGSKTISGLGPGLAPRMNSKQASGLAFGSGHRGMDSALGSGRQVLSNLGGGVQHVLLMRKNTKDSRRGPESVAASYISNRSEGHKSLASLASMMSEKTKKKPGKLRMQEANTDNKFRKGQKDADFFKKLHKVEKHIRKNKLQLTFTDQLGRAVHVGQDEEGDIASKAEAKKLAFYLFWNMRASLSRNHVLLEDVEYFLDKPKAKECFEMLDLDKDGKVSLQDMRDAVISVYESRKNLALTLKDTRSVVGKLENILGVGIHAVCFLFYLSIFNVNLYRTWLTCSTLVLAFSFSFSNTLKNLLEAIIYLFVVHPFDVGDGLFVGSSGTDYYKVEEIALLNTTLIKWDGSRVLYPNYKMNTDMITNITRSYNKGEIFAVLVDMGTPLSVYEEVEKHIKLWSEPCPDINAVAVVPGNGGNPLKFTLTVWWEYTFNTADRGRYGGARNKMLHKINEALGKVKLSYSLPPFPSAPMDRRMLQLLGSLPADILPDTQPVPLN